MIMVCVIMMATAANAEPQRVAPFSRVSVNVPARIRVIKGNEYSIMVQTKESTDSTSLRCVSRRAVVRLSRL